MNESSPALETALATPPATTTASGRMSLRLYAEGRLTRAQLDNAYLVKGWISTTDYEAAINA